MTVLPVYGRLKHEDDEKDVQKSAYVVSESKVVDLWWSQYPRSGLAKTRSKPILYRKKGSILNCDDFSYAIHESSLCRLR